ncbi:unnamed protein product [Gongylonema pulchrum]|uniref:CASP-like protein n=1 Tax=Gongylonema pulchrum TaxID=637853 RepID=A0A183D3Z5_9BILA|nr:unnamed protein product [Gongylonema pulchrum]
MAATYIKGMHTHEFVYILPWLQDGRKDAMPWLGTGGETMQKVKEHFSNTIVHVTKFLKKVEPKGLSRENLDMVSGLFEVFLGRLANIYSYLYLYDALSLYAYAIRALFNETSNLQAINNGSLVWSKMRRLQFEGCICCYLYQILTDAVTGFWSTQDGSMPLDEPTCGYRNEKCTYIIEIISAAAIFATAILIFISFIIYRYW